MRMDLIWMELRTTILIGHEIPGGMYHVHMSELLTTLYVGKGRKNHRFQLSRDLLKIHFFLSEIFLQISAAPIPSTSWFLYPLNFLYPTR